MTEMGTIDYPNPLTGRPSPSHSVKRALGGALVYGFAAGITVSLVFGAFSTFAGPLASISLSPHPMAGVFQMGIFAFLGAWTAVVSCFLYIAFSALQLFTRQRFKPFYLGIACASVTAIVGAFTLFILVGFGGDGISGSGLFWIPTVACVFLCAKLYERTLLRFGLKNG